MYDICIFALFVYICAYLRGDVSVCVCVCMGVCAIGTMHLRVCLRARFYISIINGYTEVVRIE